MTTELLEAGKDGQVSDDALIASTTATVYAGEYALKAVLHCFSGLRFQLVPTL